ncbi:MAG: hypothetical protein Q4A40_02955 [Bacillota bacterium]|nr:hypothetical protein [Bacillota bacterium]
MKILDFETCRKIGKEISPQEIYEWVENTLFNQRNFMMPVKTRMNQAEGDYYAIMPCMYEPENLAMVKMIGRHMLKQDEQRSVMMSDLLLYEADTGVLKAVMDAEYITTLRTGAVAAWSAIKYGAEDFRTVGLIGLGNIMTACMDVFLPMVKERNITLKLHKYHEHENRLMERYKDYSNISFELYDSYEDVIRDSDIVLSALTRATSDFAPNSCYKDGCTIIPIMTLGFQNCDLFFDKVFTDEIEQIRGFKYFNQFKSIENTVDVLHYKAKGRENNSERILVYNYGLATFDLYFAAKFFEFAKQEDDEMEYRYCSEKFFM